MKYAFMDENLSRFAVGEMAGMLGGKMGGYYPWKNRKPSVYSVWRRDLERRIVQLFYESRETYGSPRMTRELVKQGFVMSENTIR